MRIVEGGIKIGKSNENENENEKENENENEKRKYAGFVSCLLHYALCS